MRDKNTIKKGIKVKNSDFKMSDLTAEERQRFVGAFAWLIKEDKKQNPHLYKNNNN